MCRIGIFAFFSPTAINDSAKLLPAILTGSSKGFFGLIPEIFVAICVITELLIDKAMNWLLNKKWNSSLLSKETGVKPLNSLRLNESIENLK